MKWFSWDWSEGGQRPCYWSSLACPYQAGVSLISLHLLQESNYKQPALSIMNWLKKKTYQENCLASWKTRFIDAEARMFIRQLFIFKHWRGPIWPTRHPLHLTDPTTISTNGCHLTILLHQVSWSGGLLVLWDLHVSLRGESDLITSRPSFLYESNLKLFTS